ncbi:MAG: sugar ABC transporter permease [Clostridia bacterium]|nr:sugar ABC transporter permease [Clostridia bacterium]
MVIPVILFYVLFCYKPMYGLLMAFQNYSPSEGISGSEWVGMTHFIDFVKSSDFPRLIRNTLAVSICSLVFGFPAPIIFALLLNEVRQTKYKRVIMSFSYLPHFISLVVICGMIKTFVSRTGVITVVLSGLFGIPQEDLLSNPGFYLPIYTLSSIWQGMGWDAIIYIAALSGVDAALYEAATIDGAKKFQQMLHVTIPAILPTIIIMLILKIGQLLNVGYEKTLLLYNPVIYNRADIISTYVYRMAFEGQQWSYTTAIGLFNAVINFMLVVFANKISGALTETSLW